MATILTSLLSISSALSERIVTKVSQKVAQDQAQNIDPSSLPESGQADWSDFVFWAFFILGIVYIIYKVFFEKGSNDEEYEN